MSRDTSRQHIVSTARGWIGTPYLHQASLKGVGCDCLGLVRGIWRELYGAEPEMPPPYAADWGQAGGRETLAEASARHLVSVDNQPHAAGDVLLFRWRNHLPAMHCAIASGPMTMIHAHDSAEVAEVTIGPWWRRHLAYVFAFPQTLQSKE
jgi:NlpC/P60 family putative phage cell wall peptidase